MLRRIVTSALRPTFVRSALALSAPSSVACLSTSAQLRAAATRVVDPNGPKYPLSCRHLHLDIKLKFSRYI